MVEAREKKRNRIEYENKTLKEEYKKRKRPKNDRKKEKLIHAAVKKKL